MKPLTVMLLALLTLISCGGEVERRAYSSTQTTVTRGGAKVYTEEGITLSKESLPAIDKGLYNAIDKARCSYYGANLEPSRYKVIFLKGELSPNGIPAIRIPCGAYCGTQWDMGGYILAAGKFIEPDTLVLPEYFVHFDSLALAVEYEAEHRILYDNDTAKYEATSVHQANTGHPLIASCK